MSARDVAVFAAEMAVYVSVLRAGWRVHPAVAVVAVLVMALWWGLLHSPKARWQLDRPLDRLLRAVWFGIGAACLAWLLSP